MATDEAALAEVMEHSAAVLTAAGFALLDLIDHVSEASGLPGLLFWAVMALFGLSAVGTVLLVSAMPRQQQV